MVQWRDQECVYVSVDEDDEEIMSNMSDSDEEDPNTLFTYKPPPTGEGDACEWCSETKTHVELSLVTHDRHRKSFCSEDCQQFYKNSILSRKTCEWCNQHFPNEPSLIVVEPSLESVPLQFCTQSCINKYKMELFCEEVKEQLKRIKEDNVQLPSVTTPKSTRNERKILITPELWSKGEPALVFIDECGLKEPASSHSSQPLYPETNERKRKGTKMENVISKLSRRQLPKSEFEETEETRPCHVMSPEDIPDKPTDGQSLPINLSVYRSINKPIREDNSKIGQLPKYNNSKHSTTLQKSKGEESATPGNMKSPMIVPLPIFIPVPVPIPIPTCLTALSQALLAQSTNNNKPSTKITGEKITPTHTKPVQPRESITPKHTNSTQTSLVHSDGERRYVLKKQPASDDPE